MPVEGTRTWGRYRLVYVGIAPKKPDAVSGKRSKSMLRRSLAVEFGMNVFLNTAGKSAIPPDEEIRSTAWLGSTPPCRS